MIRKFYDTLKSLLPNGRAFKIPGGTQFRKLVESLGEEPDRIRDYFDDTRDSGIPGRIPVECLGEWETTLGLRTNLALSDPERQDRILTRMFATGGQGSKYIETIMNNAGYPVTVYDYGYSVYNLSGKYNVYGQKNDALKNEILTEIPIPLAEYGKYLTGKFTRLNRIEDIEFMACGNFDADVMVGQDGGRLYYSLNYGSVFFEIQPAGAADKDWKIGKIGYDGNFVLCGVYGGRLYRSNTGYANLAEVQPAGNTDQNWNCVSCTPDGQHILVGTNGKRLWYSSNYGVAWGEVRPLGNTDQSWLCCAIASLNIAEGGLYQVAGNGTRLYLSQDHGVNWAEIQPYGAVNKQYTFCSISTNGKIIIAGAAGDDVLKRSLDYGATWTTILDDTYYPPDGISFCMGGQADYYNYTLVLYFGGGAGGYYVYITHDCGESWKRYNPSQTSQNLGNDHPWRMALSMAPQTDTFRNPLIIYLAFVTAGGDAYPSEFNFSMMVIMYNNIRIVADATNSELTISDDLKYDFFDLLYRLKPLGTWLNCKVNFRKDWTGIVKVGNSLNLPAFIYGAMASMTNNRIAFIDGTNMNLQCYEWDGADWSQIGNDLNITGIAQPKLCSLPNGDIVFIDVTREYLECFRFDGTDWMQVGKGLNIPGIWAGGMTALTSSIIAFVESTASDIQCYRYDGYKWVAYGISSHIGMGAPFLTALTITDIAYIDLGHADLRCYRFDGANWSQIGNELHIAGLTNASICALNDSDIILSDESLDELRCYRFDGTNWAQVGAGLAVPAFANDVTIVKLTDDTFTFIDATNEDLTTYKIY